MPLKKLAIPPKKFCTLCPRDVAVLGRVLGESLLGLACDGCDGVFGCCAVGFVGDVG